MPAMKSYLVMTTVLALTLVPLGCSLDQNNSGPFGATHLGAEGPKVAAVPPTPLPVDHGSWQSSGEKKHVIETGMASWRGEIHDGRVTANGETFSSKSLFAAHSSLPLPSYVEIRNLDNNRVITVRVNDRWPHQDQLITVSERAAKILGFKKQLGARVQVRYLGLAPVTQMSKNN